MITLEVVEVVGGGLIGTSIALKTAQNGQMVRVRDNNSAHTRVANELLGRAKASEEAPVDLVVAATPVDTLSEVIVDALCRNPNSIVIDIGSIKSKVVVEVWNLLKKMSREDLMVRYLPTHPMAGREVAGPESARADLFEGRAWAITPHQRSNSVTVATVRGWLESLGAVVYELTPEEHDRQVAMSSHLPQMLSSALAGVLQEPLDLSGQGLRDMTRLANSDVDMWAPILESNQEALIPLLDQVIKSINDLKDKNFSRDAVSSFMALGVAGAAKIPGKHGGSPRNYGSLSVVIPDEAGQLAALFNHCAEAKINIEDLRIEHSPGQETGLINLYVNPDDLSTLQGYLSTLGWHCTITSKRS